MTKDVTNIDRIIAKIDNDFNPDNSDWIPRVGAWVHDGLGLLSVSTTKRVKEKFVVKDRIAYNKCEFKGKGVTPIAKLLDCIVLQKRVLNEIREYNKRIESEYKDVLKK